MHFFSQKTLLRFQINYRIELVPCSDLGLMICTVRGRILVSRVKPSSIAGEDGKVCVGDMVY